MPQYIYIFFFFSEEDEVFEASREVVQRRLLRFTASLLARESFHKGKKERKRRKVRTKERKGEREKEGTKERKMEASGEEVLHELDLKVEGKLVFFLAWDQNRAHNLHAGRN